MQRSTLAAILSVPVLATGAMAIESCSAKRGPDDAGLMVIVTTDGRIDVTSLEITVWKTSQATSARTSRLYKPGEFSLPNTVAILSDGNPGTTAVIKVVAFNGDRVVDIRENIVQQVPIDRVAAVPIVLSANCLLTVKADKSSTCGDGKTCDPSTGGCVGSTVVGSSLPTYVPDRPVEFDVGVVDTTIFDTALVDTGAADSADADTTVRDTADTLVVDSDTAVDTGCAKGTKLCGASCQPMDVAHGCGAASCEACPTANGTATCSAGGGSVLRCELTCIGVEYKKCGGACVALGDPTYGCGFTTCDSTSCPAPGAGTLTCIDGVCVIGACGVGTKKCGSACVTTDATNGCSEASRCTACGAKEACVGAPTVCTCVSDATTTTCSGKCGSVKDNCGKDVTCSGCTLPATCGGGGTANVCGCTSEPFSTTCSGKCGVVKDNCGKDVTCAGCTSPSTCGGGGIANVCGGCDYTATYPPAPGCPVGNRAWRCWSPVAMDTATRTLDFTPRTLCGDDVISDSKTKLMWARNEESGTFTWSAAKAKCVASRRAGFTDWRLPTRVELQSIVDYQKISTPTIDGKFQGATAGSLPTTNPFWSSSSHALSAGDAWFVGFNDGGVYYSSVGNPYTVRCVR